MIQFPRILLPALLGAAVVGHAAGLPDTGQDTCYTDTVAIADSATHIFSVARDTANYPRQDCRYGRDPMTSAGLLRKTGTGYSGFDYTKIANNGTELPSNSVLGSTNTEWACTRDNTTGLTWEVKTFANLSLRYVDHKYQWYSTDGNTNGGNVGILGANSCASTLPGGNCNTQAYTTAVNGAALCTYTDWRLPTQRELLTLVYANGFNPAVDWIFLPATAGGYYWSATTYVGGPQTAWVVDFATGSLRLTDKTTFPYHIRLVRGGPF
ncbi:MAG: DUF1566 domain-containing protein [Betaproteobacteria bacterium]|nr:DUF1566 domain-containing protein [Betaproteobacteria bacterium]